MKKAKTNANGLAKPIFKGDKQRLISTVQGGSQLPLDKIPYCFSDPDLESGICNPNLPLKEGEPYLCALYKSCLVAKGLSLKIPLDAINARDKSYDELLSDCDSIFDSEKESPPDPNDEFQHRQRIRSHGVCIPLRTPKNPFRKRSMRRTVLDILIQDWVSLNDLKAALLALKFDVSRLDLILSQVTSVSIQEKYDYRIVESFGKYRAFSRS